MQNDHGHVYYLRYYDDDGGVYYLNEHGQYEPVEGANLPQLLYVGDDGVAYFSKMQHPHHVYFSLDTHGDFDWVDYHDIPNYEAPPHEDEYEYPRVVDYHYGDDGWSLVQLEDGRLVKYYDEGGAYWVDEHGNEEAIYGFQTPTLLYVDHDGDSYFRVFSETEGEYRYYMIDHDGGVEYIHADDVPGYYEEPPYEDEYEYPRTIAWDVDEGWVIVENEDGHYAKFYEDGNAYPVDEHGNALDPNGYYYARLLHVDEHGNAYFRSGDEGNYTYYLIDHDGGIEYVDDDDIPVYEELEPVYEGHPPYFFEHYANPFYGDLEADGDPTFANGVYTQTYNDGEVVVTWFQEGGPYRIRYYSEENAGGDLLLDLTYDAYNYEIDAVHAGPYEYDEYEGVLPENAPEYFEFGGEQWENPEAHGYELFNQNGGLYEYRHPETGEYVSINVLDDGSYYVNYRGDEQPGTWEINFHVYANGTYEAFDGVYYDDYQDQYPPEDDYGNVIPEGAPAYFGSEEWVNPEQDERFTLEDTQTDADGAVHYLYTADLDGDGDTDYSIDVIQHPNGHVEIEYHSSEYGHEATFQMITQPNGYYGTYDSTYYINNPQGVPEYEPIAFEADGYLPDGTPEYFGDEEWVNPEYDDRFVEFNHIPNYEGTGAEFRGYHADLDGDGTWDYWINVLEHPDGTAEIQYWDGNELQATINVIVQPDGSYGTHNSTYHVNDPQGAVEYDDVDPALAAIFDRLPDNLPYEFEGGYPNPEHSDEFHYSHTVEGDSPVHYFTNADGSEAILMVENPNGTTSLYYYDKPIGEFDPQDDLQGHVFIFPGGQYDVHYYEDGVEVDGPPIEDEVYEGVLPENAPDYFEFGGEQWENPAAHGYELFNQNGGLYEYRHPVTGEYVSVNVLDDGSYYVNYRGDEQGGTWEINFHVYANGTYEAFDGTYYDDYQDQYSPEEGYDWVLPPGAPDYFGSAEWVNPVEDDRFHLVQTDTNDDGSLHHVYVADLDGDGDNDYTIDVIHHPDGRVELTYFHPQYGHEATFQMIIQPDGNYGTYDNTYMSLDPQGVPEYEPVNGYAGVLPENAPDYFEFGGEQWENPAAHGYELFNQNGDLYEYRHPDTGEYVSVNVLDDGSYYVNYRGDEPAGAWEMNFHVYANGTYEAFDGAYYDEYQVDQQQVEDAPVEDDYLPDWLPNSFEHDGVTWPSPTQDGFAHMFTNGGNAYFTNGDYTMLVHDNGDGTAVIYIDDLSNGGSWDTGFRVYSDGNYQFLEGDDLITGTQASEPEQLEELDEQGAAQIAAVHSEQEAEEGVAEDPEAGLIAPEYVFYGLPATFAYGGMAYPSPAQGDWEYQGVQAVGGVNVHQFSQGNYTVMIQDGQGMDRVVYVNDHSTGGDIDAGYILRANGTLEIHPDWAQVEPVEAETEAADPEADGGDIEAETADPEAEDEEEEDLQFVTEEEDAQPTEEAGEEPLEFNGPETGDEEPEAEATPDEPEETVEPVEVAQPDLVESEETVEPITTASDEEDLAADDLDDDDDSGL